MKITSNNIKITFKTQNILPKSQIGLLLPRRIYRPNALFIFTKTSGSGAINSRRLREAPTPDNIAGKRMR